VLAARGGGRRRRRRRWPHGFVARQRQAARGSARSIASRLNGAGVRATGWGGSCATGETIGPVQARERHWPLATEPPLALRPAGWRAQARCGRRLAGESRRNPDAGWLWSWRVQTQSGHGAGQSWRNPHALGLDSPHAMELDSPGAIRTLWNETVLAQSARSLPAWPAPPRPAPASANPARRRLPAGSAGCSSVRRTCARGHAGWLADWPRRLASFPPAPFAGDRPCSSPSCRAVVGPDASPACAACEPPPSSPSSPKSSRRHHPHPHPHPTPPACKQRRRRRDANDLARPRPQHSHPTSTSDRVRRLDISRQFAAPPASRRLEHALDDGPIAIAIVVVHSHASHVSTSLHWVTKAGTELAPPGSPTAPGTSIYLDTLDTTRYVGSVTAAIGGGARSGVNALYVLLYLCRVDSPRCAVTSFV